MRKRKLLSEQFDKEFIHGLAYLRDIFGYLNGVRLAVCNARVSLLDTDEN